MIAPKNIYINNTIFNYKSKILIVITIIEFSENERFILEYTVNKF